MDRSVTMKVSLILDTAPHTSIYQHTGIETAILPACGVGGAPVSAPEAP